jgi:hypothetical protein
MIQAIDLQLIQKKINRVKKYILAAPQKKLTSVEYRSYNEGLASACYFTTPKSDSQDSFEAFIVLLICKIAYWEGWNLQELVADDADNICNHLLFPSLQKSQFTMLTKEEAEHEMQWIMDAIGKLIDDSSNYCGYRGEAGIYLNRHERIDVHIKPSVISSGLCLFREWNLIEIFFETDCEYVLFYWFTGA